MYRCTVQHMVIAVFKFTSLHICTFRQSVQADKQTSVQSKVHTNTAAVPVHPVLVPVLWQCGTVYLLTYCCTVLMQ